MEQTRILSAKKTNFVTRALRFDTFFLFSILTLSFVLLTACGDKQKGKARILTGPAAGKGNSAFSPKRAPEPKVDTNTLLKDLKIEVEDTRKLSELQKKLLAAINSNQAVAANDINTAFLELHLNLFQKKSPQQAVDLPKALSLLSDLSSDLSTSSSIKLQIYSKIEKQKKKKIDYDSKADNLFDILLSNPPHTQCYSGTSLFTLATRFHFSENSKASPNFLFFTTIQDERNKKNYAHILPVIMELDGDGMAKLSGIEMTNLDQNPIALGLIKDMNKPFRIVETRLWMIYEIFKFSLKNGNQFAQEILKRTLDYYGLRSQLRPVTRSISTHVVPIKAPTALGFSHFAFGDSAPPTVSKLSDMSVPDEE